MFHPEGPTFFEQVRQCLSSTRKGYDLLAPKFEFTPYRTPDEMLQAVSAILETDSFETALDVCCGTGAGMRMLRPLVGRKVVGIDFSKEMLHEAQRLLAYSEGGAELEFVHGDVLEMSFDEAFDLATCFGALGHIYGKDTDLFLQKIHHALRPGGKFVFITTSSPPVCSRTFWLSHGFNLAMKIRNLVVRPPFIMYYLTFLLPEIRQTLERNGFRVEVESPEELGLYQVVVATKVG
ncbi:MAG: methyltransferase domain-containing protein [Verrucomicrobiales bacterium]|nr:methyltransferase domain-containing protein [Verrucomicrobiales bacterium]